MTECKLIKKYRTHLSEKYCNKYGNYLLLLCIISGKTECTILGYGGTLNHTFGITFGNSPSTSCSLDPWPTFLVLDFLNILITPITSIINASLEQGKCPNFFKQTHVTPILKKSSLDK